MTDQLRPEDVDDLKVVELRRELSNRRLSSSGRKSELQQRLKEYLVEDYVDEEEGKKASTGPGGKEVDEPTEPQTRRRRGSSTGSRSVSPKPGSFSPKADSDIERPMSPITRSMTRRERENSVSPKPDSRGNTPPPTPRSTTSSDAGTGRRRSPKPSPSPSPRTRKGKATAAASETPAPTPRGRRRSRSGEGAESVSPKPEDQATTKQAQEQPNTAQSPKPVASPKPPSDRKSSPKPVESKSPKPSKPAAVLETLLMGADEDILAEELKEVQKAEAQAKLTPKPTPKPAAKPAAQSAAEPTGKTPRPAAAPKPAAAAPSAQAATTEEMEFQRIRDPHPAKCAPSVTVRIDGLRRPFPLPKFKAALESVSGVKISEGDNFFISTKRTHCYLTTGSVEQAEAFRNRMCGIKYHDGHLSAEFSDITAAEASKLSEEERDLRMKVIASRDSGGDRNAALTAASAGEGSHEPRAQQTTAAKQIPGTIRAPEARRKLVSIDHAAPNSIFRGAIGSLKRQASSSSVEDTDATAKAGAKRVKAPVEDNESVGNGLGKRTRSDEAEADGDRKRTIEDTAKRPREVQQPEPETPIATLDDLFRKTNAKPALYWLPVSEEEVQKRRDAVALLRAQTGQTA